MQPQIVSAIQPQIVSAIQPQIVSAMQPQIVSAMQPQGQRDVGANHFKSAKGLLALSHSPSCIQVTVSVSLGTLGGGTTG
jgi:hypothetical protein